MLVIPAIDLLGGCAVRLTQGKREQATVYSDRPAEMADRFIAQGAKRLHVVDLDGAFAGRPENRAAVQAICQQAGVRAQVQVGGGIRDLETCAALLEQGASHVVLGTVAVKDPALLAQACARWPARVIVAVDAHDGQVAVEGWAERTEIAAAELAARMAGSGAAAILYTDIARDGMRSGPAVAETAALAYKVAPVPVIASGGIGSLEHLRALAAAGVPMCVVGRALYEGAFTVAEAIEAATGSASGRLVD